MHAGLNLGGASEAARVRQSDYRLGNGWPLAARAQQTQRQHRIAFVHSGIPADQSNGDRRPVLGAAVLRNTARAWRCRGRQSRRRALFRRGSFRPFCCSRCRGREPQPGRHRFKPQRSRKSVRGGHRHDTDRRDHRGSDRGRIGHEPRTSRGQPYGRQHRRRDRNRCQAPANLEGSDALGGQGRLPAVERSGTTEWDCRFAKQGSAWGSR